mgnify:CR=1 FL=1
MEKIKLSRTLPFSLFDNLVENANSSVGAVKVELLGGLGTRGGTVASGTRGVTLTDVEGEVPRLALLLADSPVDGNGATAADLVEVDPEVVGGVPEHGSRVGDNEGGTPDGLTLLVVDLGGVVAYAAKTEVRPGLRARVEGDGGTNGGAEALPGVAKHDMLT